jgi:hypothetical protein
MLIPSFMTIRESVQKQKWREAYRHTNTDSLLFSSSEEEK